MINLISRINKCCCGGYLRKFALRFSVAAVVALIAGLAYFVVLRAHGVRPRVPVDEPGGMHVVLGGVRAAGFKGGGAAPGRHAGRDVIGGACLQCEGRRGGGRRGQ